MLDNDQSLDSLVRGIKGITDLLSIIISRKFGLGLLFIVSAVIVAKLMM